MEKEKFITDKLSKRFEEGLKKYNLTTEEIKDWKYCGGDKDEHYNYFTLKYGKDTIFPEHQDNCVCDHDIKYNCYISKDDKLFLVLGNCCIKKFIPKSTRTCKDCGNPHKSSKHDFCKECKQKHESIKCEGCNKLFKSKTYKKCIDCRNKQICIRCDKKYKINDSSEEEENVCKKCIDKVQCEKCEEYFNEKYIDNQGSCTDCSVGFCRDCGRSINEKYKLCYNCKFSN